MRNIKKSLLQSRTITIVLTLAIILIISSFYSNKMNQRQKPLATDLNSDVGNVLSGYSQSRYYNDASFTNKDLINILLIGQDKRPGEGHARSDSIIIATVNKKSSSIKVTSLMRDMYVHIPGYSENKINASYAYGGMDLLTETVEENFLVKIDGCIEVDFSGFEKIIDEIGGVDIELNEDEAYYLSRNNDFSFTEGPNKLNGKTALEYARIRYIGNDDYERTERQRKLLIAVFNKLKDSNIKTLLDMSNDIIPLVKTNLKNSQILNLVTNVILMKISDIETYRIPANGEFTPATINNMSVLVPNLYENQKLLNEFIGN